MREHSWGLQTKIVLLEIVVLLAVLAVVGVLVGWNTARLLEKKIGENALDVARVVARIPQIREGVESEYPVAAINPIAEEVRRATGASFVVVADTEGISYSHPLPELLWTKMIGGDNYRALMYGEEYVARGVGSMGPSLWGKVPLYDLSGARVGVVSVGFVAGEIGKAIWAVYLQLLPIVLLGLLVGIAGAVVISRNVKKEIFGLEPRQIAALLEERNAILHSIREGIIAINERQRITVANREARTLLGLGEDVIGREVTEVIPSTRLPEVLRTGQPDYDQEHVIGETVIVSNRVPFLIDGRVAGVVASFRDRTEVTQLAEQLAEVRRYTDALRAQNHEFMNTLHTISGLIQLDCHREAVELISKVSERHQALVEFLMRHFRHPALAALLLGKYNRARELGIDLHIGGECDPEDWPGGADDQTVITIVGNLVDNAVEAVKDMEEPRRRVTVRVTRQDGDLRVTVRDTGPGVPRENLSRIFDEGFTTKGPARGIGLSLVKRRVESLGGSIRVETDGITSFQVRIPCRAVARS